VPPATFIFLYIAAIFGYAVIYTFMSGAFYDSSTKTELYSSGFGWRIALGIKGALVQNFFVHNHSYVLKRSGWTLNVHKYFVESPVAQLQAIDPDVDFHVIVPFQRPSGYSVGSFVLHYAPSGPPPPNSVGNGYSFVTFTANLPRFVTMRDLIPGAESGDHSVRLLPGQVGFPVPRPVDAAITSFYLAAEGNPGSLPDDFPRMLYFSATTITTLGYGDIIPVTDSARLTVATEALAGIILIGLFINSIFVVRARRSQTPPHS